MKKLNEMARGFGLTQEEFFDTVRVDFVNNKVYFQEYVWSIEEARNFVEKLPCHKQPVTRLGVKTDGTHETHSPMKVTVETIGCDDVEEEYTICTFCGKEEKT